ncbi:hypothetical protein SAMN05216582_102114 [Selenomonas ruminantium]|uniref:Lipoprotein n=1 Tax=Selenomonas ruminantium TaxID=971 RepID=A0A1M6RK99_SELRU|nr:hypothetical protein [Selenomonas ruminantium]SHK32788.1 hypothetical protein SAMN05216582_102114 [Selenomonas ruminantium]
MKSVVCIFMNVMLLLGVISISGGAVASAATLVCTKCDVQYNDRELIAEGKGKENCSQGGKHFFRPIMSPAPETKNSFKMVVRQMQGDWYNKKGTCISVKNNYFNGCRILDVGEVAGGGSNFGTDLYLDEAEGARKLRVSVQISPEAGNETFSDGTQTPRIVINNVAYYKR